MNRFCNDTGVGLIPWAPLAAGKLARKVEAHGSTERSKSAAELTVADKEVVKRVEELAGKKGWTMSQVALAWVNKRVSSPIIGFSSKERMEEAIGARGKTLSEEEENYLEEPYVAKGIIGHS